MTMTGKDLEVGNNGAESVQLEPVVISGLSGRFPESSNVEEFAENLFGGVDMITEDGRRWTPGIYGLPTRSGKLKELDKFDADFFSVHAKQADFMDPQLRMLLEVTHEAIMDAGVNPQEVRGQNVGVFIGASASESETQWINDTTTKHGYALTGCERTMCSNRISFAFDFKGPSFTLDTACSSSLMALGQACAALKFGHCDAAIVGGVHLCLNPKTSLQFHKLNMLSPHGKCQSFDAAGDGYVRSEAVVVIFLQRKNVARRQYASILGVKTNTDGHKPEGVTFPSGEMQKELLQSTYKEAGIDPKDVVYVEAHGTGTPAGDPQEINAIAEVFCKDRNPENPLLIGSVKSNMGHSEPVSGLCGVAKVLLAMQRGIIPGNLHFKASNPSITSLKSGQLKVVSENVGWKGGVVGINSFGFGGANVHAILQSNPKGRCIESHEEIPMEIPYIIPFSGRSKDSVSAALKEISTSIYLNDEMRFPHEIHSKNIPGNQFRGFAVISENKAVTEICVDEIKPQSESPKMWFIFNGMGSQWAGMGKSLMKFQACKESLEKSAAILKTKNLDLLDILLNGKEAFENVLNSFVSIAAVQIALFDLLSVLNIKPDGVIGHSIGELCAAYADNCLTAEQVILTAHARGRAILEMGPGDGAMAAVGLSWEAAIKKCPEGVYPACHNSKDSVTVSGPAKLIDDFVDELQNDGIFARKVNSSNQAFHSKYIEPAKLKFKESLDKIIPVPKPRSDRWISSSIPEAQWNSELSKTSSADYHVNNLISPVLFEEAVEKVPASSVVIEIGPHCLLQAILKRSLSNCSHIGLLNKNHKDNSIFLVGTIGKMFNAGLNPKLSALYPEMGFPVPPNTPSLSSVVSKCWDHSKSWNVASFSSTSCFDSSSVKNDSGGLNFEISLDNEEDAFYAGHKIDGRIIFPQTGLIVLAWKAWAQIYHGNMNFEEFPFTIENFEVSRATIIPKKGGAPLNFNVSIKRVTGQFWVEENGFVVASGIIRSPSADDFILVDPIPIPHENAQKIVLNQQDFYKFIKLRGYEYSGVFQGVRRISLEAGWAEIEFSNWVAFLDNLLHPLVGYHGETKSLLLPTRLKKVVIDPKQFWEHLTRSKDFQNSRKAMIFTFHNPNIELLFCAGVQIQGQKLEPAPRNLQNVKLSVLEKFEFTPNFDDLNSNASMKNTDGYCLQTCIGLVLENLHGDELNVLEIGRSPKNIISHLVSKFCHSQPKKIFKARVIISDVLEHEEKQVTLENSEIKIIHEDSEAVLKDADSKRNLLILHEMKNLKDTVRHEKIGAFVLLRVEMSGEQNLEDIQVLKQNDFITLSHKNSRNFSFYLFKKMRKPQLNDNKQTLSSTVTIDPFKKFPNGLGYNYDWVEKLRSEIGQVTKDKIDQGFRINVICASFDSGKFCPSGILGLVNSLRLEPGGQALRCFFINDPDFPVFNFQQPDSELQTIIQTDLLMNVYQNGVWGSYRFFPLEPQNSKQVENAYLNFQKRGDLSSFRWLESPLKYSNENSCSVYYSALNFRDVMLASGKLNPGSLPNNLGNEDCILGMEFSGLDSKGKRVMGILPAKAMATSVIPDPGFLWEVPMNWSLADAATVPVAYATAYYALCVRGRLQKGESVLIHGGAGAVGLAAISIALSKKCRVFTTVSSTEKREFLKTSFPKLNDSCFANSRDTSFLQHIMNETNGRGVDVVLNSLAGDKLVASVDCTAQHGRFLELGKVDLFNDTKLGMSFFLKDVNFSGILLDSLTSENTEKSKVWKYVATGIESGVVQPLQHTIFSDSVEEVEKAFRYMASGKHIGKILIRIRKEDEKPEDKIVKALPRTYFNPSKSYIILGGLGGFGLELCDWMIERGATKLMLISRSGVTNGYQKLCLSRWNKSGSVSVVTSTIDAATNEGATEILKKAIDFFSGAPVGGIFNLAMVVRDGLLENQIPQNFEAAAKPKINASVAMDRASRALAPELEHFVCFSSISSGRGSPGLSSYAYANSAMERICEMRKKEGLPALVIQWGPIGDVGVLVDRFQMSEDKSMEGSVPQNLSSCLNTLDIFLQSSALTTGAEGCSTLSSFVLASKSKDGTNTSQNCLVESIARILGLKAKDLEKNPNQPFHAFGMDSLMAAEMKQLIEVTLGRESSALDLQNLSLYKFLEIMPTVTKNPNGTGGEIENHAANETENSLPVKCKHDNLDDYSQYTGGKIKTANFITIFCILRNLIACAISMVLLTIVYFILLPIFSVIRACVKTFIWMFHDSSQIKLVDGIAESFFITDNANTVHILKFSGVPKRDQVINLLQQRLFSFRTNVNLDAGSNCETMTQEFYKPFERLQWSIEEGFWFCYWKKNQNFDLAHHVILEENASSDLDKEIPRLAKHYHNLKWNEHWGSFSSRPWWEIRIVNSQKAKEFLMAVVWNHAYGDGPSAVRLFQQIFMEITPTSLQKKEDHVCTVLKPVQSSMFGELNHVLAKTWEFLCNAHLLIESSADVLLKTWDTRKDTFVEPEPHAASAFAKFPLHILKSVKDPETGRSFNLNAVVLAVCARVYRRIVKESKMKGIEAPAQLLPTVTWSPSHDFGRSLVNDSVIIPTIVPLAFDSQVQQGCLFGDDITSLVQTIRITETNLAAAGDMKKLLQFRQLFANVSVIPIPVMRLLMSKSFRSSFVYSNILFVIPKATSLLNGYKLKDIYGFAGPAPFSVIAITDSINDSLTVTVTVGETTLKTISPEFHQLFFPYFEQEMKKLQKWFMK